MMLTSFLQSNLRTINDIWDSNNLNFKLNDIYNYNGIYRQKNSILEAISEKYIKVLKGKTEIVSE